MESIFTNIYAQKQWGDNNCGEYNGSSGPGSSVDYNKNSYIPFLQKFINNNNIKSVVDLGCGDFKCGPLIYDDLCISYTGYDAYKPLVDYNSKHFPQPKYTFVHLDFCNNVENINNGDLYILKDVLQHWSISSICTFLDFVIEQKKCKYILITNCCNQKQHMDDTIDGGWRALSCDYFPLLAFNPKKLYNYNTKEVSVITIK